jgi:O-antigen/teichoic acid export membrane protein
MFKLNQISNKYHPVLKGISWMFFSSTIGSLLRFLLIFVLIKFYTQEEFGLWASITSIAAVIITGDFGITNVLRNLISKEITNGDEGNKESEKYFYSAFFFFLSTAILFSIILYFISPYIPFEGLFKTDNDLIKQQGRSIFLIIQFIFLFGMPLGIGIPLFFSYGESKYYSIINIFKSVISFLIVLLLAIFSFSIVDVSIFYFSTNLILSLIGTSFFIFKRKWYHYHIDIKDIYRRNKKMLSVGIKFLGIQLASSFIPNAITIYSGSMVSLSVAANINVVQKIFTFVGGIYQSAFNPLWGELATAYQSKNYNWCKTLINKSLLVTVLFYSILIIIVTLSGNILLKLIAGAEFEASISLFILLGLLSMAKMVFDNASLLQCATNKMSVNFWGYLIFAGYVLMVIPIVLSHWGVDFMILNMLLLWSLFIAIVYFNFIKMLKNEN